MRIVPGTSGAEVSATSTVGAATKKETPTPSTSASDSLQSAALQPALAALNELPDVDQAKVDALRDALAKGELPFDAGKLAALIESYHRAGDGSQGRK
jgi:negative regulator of flagellin synthesis FlgM